MILNIINDNKYTFKYRECAVKSCQFSFVLTIPTRVTSVTEDISTISHQSKE